MLFVLFLKVDFVLLFLLFVGMGLFIMIFGMLICKVFFVDLFLLGIFLVIWDFRDIILVVGDFVGNIIFFFNWLIWVLNVMVLVLFGDFFWVIGDSIWFFFWRFFLLCVEYVVMLVLWFFSLLSECFLLFLLYFVLFWKYEGDFLLFFVRVDVIMLFFLRVVNEVFLVNFRLSLWVLDLVVLWLICLIEDGIILFFVWFNGVELFEYINFFLYFIWFGVGKLFFGIFRFFFCIMWVCVLFNEWIVYLFGLLFIWLREEDFLWFVLILGERVMLFCDEFSCLIVL